MNVLAGKPARTRDKKINNASDKGSIVLKRLFFGMLLMVMGYSSVVSANVAPTVSLVLPVNNATYLAPASIPLTANAADSDGTIAKVDYYVNGSLLGTITAAPFRANWSNVSAGTYAITAVATDNLGLATTSNSATVVVYAADATNTAPTVSLAMPVNNATYLTSDTILLYANASDSNGSINRVEFYINGSLYGTDTVASYNGGLSGLAAGTYSVTARAYDNKGLSTLSTAVTVTVYAPDATNTAPTASLILPTNNATYLASDTIPLYTNATDSNGSINRVEYYINGSLLGTDTVAPYASVVGLVAGTYSITVKAYDNKGLSRLSSAVTITVYAPDATNTAPTVSLTQPVNNTIYVAPATVSVSANAADSNGSINRVEFYLNGSWAGTVTAAPYAGTFVSMASGVYTIMARAFDNKGLSTTSTAATITVNDLPTVSITAPANGAVFNAPAAITLTANAADSNGTVSKVDFYDGATLLGTDTTSPYSLALTGVVAGTHNYTAKATDNLGGVTTSTVIAVTVNALPTVSITAPANGAVFNAPAAITLTANAADSDGTISKVEFYNGATLLGTDTVSPYSWALSGVITGSYNYTAKAYDNRSAVRTSAVIAVTVNALPTVSITAPTNGAVFNAPATITLTANAADSDGTISKVDFYDGATLLGTDTVSPYSLALTGVVAGRHSYTAKATDNLGGVNTSAVIAVTVNALPTVSITAPANGAVFSAPAAITLTANAADSDGTISKVEFYNGATLLGTDTASPYSWALSGVVAGSYSYTAKAYDNRSAVTTSVVIAVTVNALPTVSITAPTNGAVFNAPAAITLTANATDSDGTISKVDFYDGATLLGTDTTSPYSLALTGVVAGSHSYTAKATDNLAGVTTSAVIAVTVNALPTVSITAPATSAVFNAPAAITLTANATDSDGTVSKVDFYDGATLLLGTDTTSPYSLDLIGVAVGSHSYTAKATDNRGGVTTSTIVAVTVNALPTLSITAPANGAVITPVPASITLTATAADSDGTVSKVDFYDGIVLLGTDTTSPYSLALTGVVAGSHTYTGKVTDNRGAVGVSSVITITAASANALPAVSLTAPVNGTVFTAPATIALAASASDTGGTIASVEFFNGSTLVGTVTAAPYNFTLSNVVAGNYVYTAKATDNLGGVTISSVVNVVVNPTNALPSVAITSPASGTVLTAPANITLTANAADSGGTVSKVDFYDGTLLLGTDTTSPYSLALTGVVAGSHTYTAKATDNGGGVTTSTPVAVSVGSVVPITYTYDELGRLIGVNR
jgi:hypothetical protein